MLTVLSVQTYLAVLPADPDVGEDGGVHAEVLHDDGLQVFHLGDGLVVDLAPVPLHHVPHLFIGPLLDRGVLGEAEKVEFIGSRDLNGALDFIPNL